MLQEKRNRVALVFVMLFNLAGMASCITLIGLVAGKDAGIAAHLAQSIRHAIRLFVAGAFVTIVPGIFCWVEVEFLLPTSRIPPWSMNILILASGILFLLAGWQLPHAIVKGLLGW